MHGFILARRWSVEAEEGVKQLHTVLLHAKKRGCAPFHAMMPCNQSCSLPLLQGLSEVRLLTLPRAGCLRRTKEEINNGQQCPQKKKWRHWLSLHVELPCRTNRRNVRCNSCRKPVLRATQNLCSGRMATGWVDTCFSWNSCHKYFDSVAAHWGLRV